MEGSPFRSWLIAGFEASYMTFNWTPEIEEGRIVDVAEESGHIRRAQEDYGLSAANGLRAARDALNWKRIEVAPGRYDWSSFLHLLDAADAAGVQVVWDLCHFGVPEHVDPFAADFAERFTAYAEAAARVFASRSDAVPVWTPVNEISYWSFAGGEHAHFAPHGAGRGDELKRQFVRASISAIEALRAVDSRARFLAVDPVMHTVGPDGPDAASEAEREAQFQAWDMLSGRYAPELGGRPDLLDLVGVNYYANNQWFNHGGREPIDRDHPHHRRPRDLFLDVARRYGRPMMISETGAEGAAGPPWMRYVADEVEAAIDSGADIQGVCLYPVMDYPGWINARHCPCGLITIAPGWGDRSVDRDMARALKGIDARHRSRAALRRAEQPPATANDRSLRARTLRSA